MLYILHTYTHTSSFLRLCITALKTLSLQLLMSETQESTLSRHFLSFVDQFIHKEILSVGCPFHLSANSNDGHHLGETQHLWN